MEEEKKDQIVQFDYIKTPDFRNIHVDGVHGGVAPSGFLNMVVFSTRKAIPQQITNLIQEDGTLGSEIRDQRVSRTALVRDLEANLIMSLPSAVVLRDWLSQKIDELDQVLAKHEEDK